MRIRDIFKLSELIFLITLVQLSDTTNTTTTPAILAAEIYSSERIAKATPVSVSKCCPDDQNLDLTNPNQPACVQLEVAESPFKIIEGLDIKSKNASPFDIELVKIGEEAVGLPNCFSGFEVHKIVTDVKEGNLHTHIR